MREERRQFIWKMGVLARSSFKKCNGVKLFLGEREMILGRLFKAREENSEFEDAPTNVVKREETRVVKYEEIPPHLKGKKKVRPAWQWMEITAETDWDEEPTIPCGLVCKHLGEPVEKSQIVEESIIVTNKEIVDELDVVTGMSLYYDE